MSGAVVVPLLTKRLAAAAFVGAACVSMSLPVASEASATPIPTFHRSDVAIERMTLGPGGVKTADDQCLALAQLLLIYGRDDNPTYDDAVSWVMNNCIGN